MFESYICFKLQGEVPKFQHMGCGTNKVIEAHGTKVGGAGHMDPLGWSRVGIRESMSSALTGVGPWIRLCVRELLKAVE